MRRLTGRQRRAALALAVVAVLFIAFDLVGAPLAGARGGVQGFFGGLYRGTDSVMGTARSWVSALPHLGSDRSTIDRLQKQNAELTRQLQQRSGDASTARAVARLQLQAKRGGYRIAPARVTAIGGSGTFDWTVTLDAGWRDGIRADQTVIAGPDLVGRVLSVTDTASVVLLAADPGSGVGARIQRTGELGLLVGHGQAPATFTPLDPATVVRAGDLLVSGPSQRSTYVGGLVLGRVTDARTSTSGALTATVRPAVRPTALDVVGVVLVGGRTGPRPAVGSTPSEQAQR